MRFHPSVARFPLPAGIKSRPRTVKLPAIVKPLCEEASRGISQASIVDSDEAFVERIKFIHDNMSMDAIAEEYIEGRELYVSVIGNKRLMVLPPREMKFGQWPEDEPRIATYKAKWTINTATIGALKVSPRANWPTGSPNGSRMSASALTAPSI